MQSDVIKVQTVAESLVRLTGESSGISQLASASFQGTINPGGQLSINANNLNINYSPHMETTATTITTVNNIEEILSEIDKSSFSPEDKEKMKGILSKVYDELKSLGAIAAPYIPMFLNMFTKGNPT